MVVAGPMTILLVYCFITVGTFVSFCLIVGTLKMLRNFEKQKRFGYSLMLKCYLFSLLPLSFFMFIHGGFILINFRPGSFYRIK